MQQIMKIKELYRSIRCLFYSIIIENTLMETIDSKTNYWQDKKQSNYTLHFSNTSSYF